MHKLVLDVGQKSLVEDTNVEVVVALEAREPGAAGDRLVQQQDHFSVVPRSVRVFAQGIVERGQGVDEVGGPTALLHLTEHSCLRNGHLGPGQVGVFDDLLGCLEG